MREGVAQEALPGILNRSCGGGAVVIGMNDHTVSQSLYLRDPDGNEVELYVDADEFGVEKQSRCRPSAVQAVTVVICKLQGA